MVNGLWIFMIVGGFVFAFFTGNLREATQGALEGATHAVELCFGLAGVYALWLGLMNIGEKSGLVERLSKRMGKVMGALFPHVPANHPAMGAMTMNIMANMLGLGNAATPLGIRAMEELQTLNKNKGRATHEMAMFLIINTSSVQLIPATVIALRSSYGSLNPEEIIVSSLIATTCSTLAGIISAKLFRRYYGP